MPYLADGSTGIGLALDTYLARRADAELADARDGIALAARSAFYVQPGCSPARRHRAVPGPAPPADPAELDGRPAR